MKAVILAGGLGTRLSEETGIRPKPMVEIGEKPILWHILKIYYAHQIKDFIICCGYKSHIIKEYFANYYLRSCDVTFDMSNSHMEVHRNNSEDWRVTLVDTGEMTMTGGRIKRVQEYIGNEDFCLTYGDGISNINITELIEFHKKNNTYATVVAVQPPGRFGAFTLKQEQIKVDHFREKPSGDNAWINGGFFVLSPQIFNYIEGDHTVWEAEPLEQLANEGNLTAYRHHGFWHPMDTLRDKYTLEEMWRNGNALWKVW